MAVNARCSKSSGDFRNRVPFANRAFAPPDGGLAGALRDLEIEVLSFERTREPAGKISPAERTAQTLAPRIDADLVHGNSLSTALFTGLAGRLVGVPAISHVREIERLNPTRARRVSANDSVICVSSAVRNHLAASGVDEDRLAVVRNGVDLARWNPTQVTPGLVRKEFEIAANVPLVAIIGQISMRKATDVFVDALALAANEVPHLHALIVGARFSTKGESIAFEQTVTTTIANRDLADRVRIAGWRKDVPSVLRDIDLLVHAARQEPLGRVLIEAAASATACVATNVGGSAEIVDDGVTGWLVPPDDSARLASAVVRAVADRTALQEAGLAARRLAKERFDAERAARETLAVYRSLVGD